MEMDMENLNIHHRRPHSSIKRHLNQKTKTVYSKTKPK